MNAASDAGEWIDFVPDRSQLARLAVAGPAGAPPVWVAMAAVAAALGLSLSLALPPATSIRRGAVTAGAPAVATDDAALTDVADDAATPRSFELFHLPAWHDESTVTAAAREASAGDAGQ